MFEYGFLFWWGTSLILGLYLIFIHDDLWAGIPLTIFGSMVFWGFIYSGINSMIERMSKKEPSIQ